MTGALDAPGKPFFQAGDTAARPGNRPCRFAGIVQDC